VPGGPNPLSNFVKVRKLGEGGFGKVYLVLDQRDRQHYVMKEVDLSKLDAKGRAEATKECAFLARMSHPNIISYKEYFEVAGTPQQQQGPWNAAQWGGRPGAGAGPGGVPAKGAPSTLYIVMSYADGGDLEARIKAQQKLGGVGPHARFVPFPEQQV
jgi:serine/threonine protein kinase